MFKLYITRIVYIFDIPFLSGFYKKKKYENNGKYLKLSPIYKKQNPSVPISMIFIYTEPKK